MKASAFQYERPRDVPDAIRLLASQHGDAKPLAGGQSLGPMLNLRLARPKLVVDISRIDALHQMADEGRGWRVGAAVTHSRIEDYPLQGLPILSQVAGRIAYRSVRNRGTVGGSVAHADPAADWPLVLATLAASARIVGPGGPREVAVDKLTTGAFETVLTEDEIIESIYVPKLSSAARWGYYKFCRKPGEFPDASAAVLLDPQRRIARIYAGALERPPQPLVTLAKVVAERTIDTSQPDAAQLIDAELARVAPHLSSVQQRLHRVIVRRAIEQALSA